MRTLAAVALAVAFSAGSAFAQATLPSARDVFRAQHVDDLFTAVADAPQIVARHNQSRLVCRFDAALGVDFHVYDSQLPRGDDVSCAQNQGTQTVTLYATRYAQPMTLEAAIAESVYEITTVSPQARPVDVPALADPMASFESATRAFIIPNAYNTGDTVYSRTSVAVVDGWVYLMRFSAPAAEVSAPARAESVWRQFASDLASPPALPPTP